MVSSGWDIDLGQIAVQQREADFAGPVKLSAFGTTRRLRTATVPVAAVVVTAGGIVSMIQGDGTMIRQQREADQVGSSSIQISQDQAAAGWLVESDFCCTSYPLPFLLVVSRPGKSLRRFRGDGRAIFGWRFVEGSQRVALFQSFPHGPPAAHYELRDVATERLRSTWQGDLTSHAPRWAQALGNGSRPAGF